MSDTDDPDLSWYAVNYSIMEHSQHKNEILMYHNNIPTNNFDVTLVWVMTLTFRWNNVPSVM